MSEQVSVSGPVQVRPDSKERVAFDLMNKIATNEAKDQSEKSKREYWFELYFECLSAIRGHSTK